MGLSNSENSEPCSGNLITIITAIRVLVHIGYQYISTHRQNNNSRHGTKTNRNIGFSLTLVVQHNWVETLVARADVNDEECLARFDLVGCTTGYWPCLPWLFGISLLVTPPFFLLISITSHNQCVGRISQEDILGVGYPQRWQKPTRPLRAEASLQKALNSGDNLKQYIYLLLFI